MRDLIGLDVGMALACLRHNYINPTLCPRLAHIVQLSPWPTFGPHFAFFAHIGPNAGMASACLRHE